MRLSDALRRHGFGLVVWEPLRVYNQTADWKDESGGIRAEVEQFVGIPVSHPEQLATQVLLGEGQRGALALGNERGCPCQMAMGHLWQPCRLAWESRTFYHMRLLGGASLLLQVAEEQNRADNSPRL